MKKFWLTVLSYLAISMALGMSWHFFFFKETYDVLGIYNRAEPIIPLGMLSMLVQGMILAYLFPKFYRGNRPFYDGMIFSLTMGLFLFSVSTLSNAAKIQVSSMPIWLLVQTGFHLIQFLLVGLVLGKIYSTRT